MGTKGWKRGLHQWHELREKGGKRERRGYTPEREARAQDRRRGTVDTGREIGPPVKQRAQREKKASGSVAGWRRFFKTRYGRTGQSTVPVRCTPDSAQKLSGEPPDSAQEKGFLARGCRCTGHCTVQCPVHTGLSGEPRQREDWKILNFSI